MRTEEGSTATKLRVKDDTSGSGAETIYCQGCYLHVECFHKCNIGAVNIDKAGYPYQLDSSSSMIPEYTDQTEKVESHEIADNVADGLVDANVPAGLSDRFRASDSLNDIMYVGDHIHGDIVPARKLRRWVSVAIVGKSLLFLCEVTYT